MWLIHRYSLSLSPPPFNCHDQVTRKAAQAYAERHNMVAYIELSAKDISYLQLLEDAFATLAKQMVKTRQEVETNSLSRSTTPGIYVVGSQGEADMNNLFARATAPSGKPVVSRSRQEVETRLPAAARVPARVGSSRRTARYAIPEDFPSTGSMASDWVILSPPDEQVPDYVVLAQEKKRSEPDRCSC